MRNLVLCLSVAACSAGCNATQLQFTTLRQSRTIPDLQQKQVMENFARLSADAGLLPYFDLVSVGTSAVTDRGAASFTLASAVKEFTSGEYGGEAAREISGNWTISPTNDPNRLAAMRAAYMIALGREEEIAKVDFQRLHDFLILNYDDYVATEDPHSVIPSGWLCVGDKASRPKGAHYVAHWGGVYVWVKEGRLRDLANFSLIILDIATLHPDSPNREPGSGGGEEDAASFAAKRDSSQQILKDIDSQLKLNAAEIRAVQEKAKKAAADDASSFQGRINTLEETRDRLVDERAGLVVDETLANRSMLQLERRKNATAGAAARIPNRLNGPAFNQGLFLLPR